MAGGKTKDQLPVYGPVTDWRRKSKLITELKENGRIIRKRQFVLDEAKGWETSEKFQSLNGKEVLSKVVERTFQRAREESAEDKEGLVLCAIFLDRDFQGFELNEVEFIKVDLEEAMKRVLNIASSAYAIQEVLEKEGKIEFEIEEVEEYDIVIKKIVSKVKQADTGKNLDLSTILDSQDKDLSNAESIPEATTSTPSKKKAEIGELKLTFTPTLRSPARVLSMNRKASNQGKIKKIEDSKWATLLESKDKIEKMVKEAIKRAKEMYQEEKKENDESEDKEKDEEDLEDEEGKTGMNNLEEGSFILERKL
ncbi:hypothetical protein EV426DRAFT_699692 [Tirmania nivea]|nr:hypothetical protein EV426DRAFT_699692 [Tirmania nivea]